MNLSLLTGLALILVAQTAVPGEFKTLSGHVPAMVSHLSPLGRLPATNQLRLAIGLRLRDPAGLTNFLAQLYDPTSTNYHQYLTPDQFTARFGPTEQDFQAVQDFARTNGLTVAVSQSNGLVLDVVGPVAAVEQAFHVTLRTFRHPTEPRDFFAPDTEPTVDAALPVVDVQGLSDYARPHSNLKKIQPSKTTPLFGTAPDGSGEFFGNDFRNAYVSGTGLTGAGQQVGLFQTDGFYASDIAAYARAAGNGRTNIPIQAVLLDGFKGVPYSADFNGEVSLDIEMAMAMAPGLSGIVVFEGNPTNFIPNDILNAMAAHSTVKNLSCSWGWGGGPSATTDAIFQKMAAQGQSFFTASGDNDAFTVGAGSTNGVDNPDLSGCPASSPYITVVGGTTLTMSYGGMNYASETVWNSGTPNANGGNWGSSGGVSAYYALPAWQQGVSMKANGGSTEFRNIPDVALTADNIYTRSDNGETNDTEGTSCAAPLWAAFMALVNQQAAAAGASSAGFVNPAIYSIGKSSAYGACFHDITKGNNYWPGSPTNYSAVAGYDLCTGWGTPGGASLINALAPTTHFVWSSVASPQTVGGAFPIMLTVQNGANETVVNFTGTANLTATLPDGTAATIIPSVVGPFTNGVWNGAITVQLPGDGVELTASDGFNVRASYSNPFTLNPFPCDYTTNNGAVTITSYLGSMRVVTIPATINGLPVTAIGAFAFQDSPGLTSLTLSNGITTIGDYAFCDCLSLTNIILPASVTNLGNQALVDCFSLQAITVNAGNPAFAGEGGVLYNRSLTTLLECPEGREGMTYTVSNGVTQIGGWAFVNCFGLASLSLPATVTNLGDNALNSCPDLNGVYFHGNAPSVGAQVFDNDANPTVYYYAGTSGWGATLDGVPAVMLNAPNPAGSLQVNLTPVWAVSAGAQWQVDGGVPQPNGATVLGLATGPHKVSCSAVSGWLTPGNQTITITAGQTNIVVATYVNATRPTLTIASPQSGQRLTNAVCVVTGMAHDPWQVSNVVCSVNNAAGDTTTNATTANGWTNWTALVTLSEGTNVLTAYAVDPSGQRSLVVSNQVTCAITTPLTVRTNYVGGGAISPNDNGAWLQIGNAYTLTATAAPGFAFTNWTGGTSLALADLTNGATLRFVMVSNLVLQANFRDVQPPVVAITNLAMGQRVSSAVFNVKGTASDNVLVTNVALRLNGGAWTNAHSRANWSLDVQFSPGTNSVQACAVDSSGNLSATNTVLCDYVVTNQLGVRLNGLGALSPNDSNAWLEIGRNYSLTAAPAAGFVFTNWTMATNWQGGVVTNHATVQFRMASNLTLTANFVETTRPVVTITNPVSGRKLSAAGITVQGTAGDNWGVTKVWCQINASTWMAVLTTNNFKNWSTNLNLSLGTNVIRVYALNFGGDYSLTNSVTVVATNVPPIPKLPAGRAVVTAPPGVFISGMQMTAGGLAFRLQITGAATGRLQVSTNLADWETVTNFAGTNTAVSFCDPGATNAACRFYRAVAP